MGKGVTIWAPKGPDFGKVEVSIDGNYTNFIDLYAASEVKSSPVFSLNKLVPGFHAAVLKGTSGHLVIDSVDIVQ